MKLKYDTSISTQFVINGTDTFPVIWRKVIFGFRQVILESSNYLVEGIVDSLMFLDSRIMNV